MKAQIRKEKLSETVKKINAQIEERFPGAGLSKLATEIAEAIDDAGKRAEAISRPHIWLRVGLGLLVLIAVGGMVAYFRDGMEQKPAWQIVVEFLDATKGSTALIVAAVVFLYTLEPRFKRRRALRALHELRGLAHLIDMHQLSKNPTDIGRPVVSLVVAGRPLDAESMRLYLHYCTELLAVVSKIGQLYVQDFPDSEALAAVNQFENLATGLSSKIWQKLMILDRIPANHAPTTQ
jgi:hypothetical protein